MESRRFRWSQHRTCGTAAHGWNFDARRASTAHGTLVTHAVTRNVNENKMTDDQPPPKRTNVLRFTRAYSPSLRERFPVEETPADELMDLLEQAEQRYVRRQSAEGG
jgi:hypothetical protein